MEFKWIIFFSIVGLLIFSGFFLRAYPKFKEEFVRIDIQERTGQIQCDFWLESNLGFIPFMFPFPTGNQEPPEKIEILENKSPRPFLVLSPEKLFWVGFLQNGRNLVKFNYEQKYSCSDTCSFTYIVSSARSWGEPLEKAKFLITLPEGAELISISYPYTKTDDGYLIELSPFWPEDEVTVIFMPKGKV